jgi:phosphoserine/homoserine phosphotransferase
MRLVCLDLEGVLIPEIWIAFADAVGIPQFRRTTRDEPDYNRLMRYRLDLLDAHRLKLPDIQRVIGGLEPLDGALEFVQALRQKTQLIILSDTFEQFAQPLMAKLGYPTLFCNSLLADGSGTITDYQLRQQDGKMRAVRAFKELNLRVFAAGDSYNDLKMIREADRGCLFRAPEAIRASCADIPATDTYQDFMAQIDAFLQGQP